MAVSEEESSSSRAKTKRNSRSSDAFYLAKTVLRGSVVLQAVRGHFRSQFSEDMVFGKETSIELVIIDEDGIVQSISEQPVFGTIKDLAVLPWNDSFQAQCPKMSGKDMLIVISDSGKLTFLSFCNEMHRFSPLTHIQLSTPGNARNQIGRMLTVDSSGCFVAASAYEEQLAIFSISLSPSGDIVDKRISVPPEKDGHLKTDIGYTNISGTIWSMCFISQDYREPEKEQNAVLAILLNRRRSFYRNELMLLEWNIKEQSVHVVYKYAEDGPLAHHIVQVPNFHGYAFMFKAGDIVLMDFKDVHNPSRVQRISLNFTPVEEEQIVEQVVRLPDIMDEEGMHHVAASALLELSDINKNDDPMNIDDYKPGSNFVCSWSWEPTNHNPRIIFSADSGDLHVIEVMSDTDHNPRVNLSACLYKCFPSKSLLWLDGGFVVAIAEMADGMVLKFEDGLLQYRSSIQNISPILDMAVVDYPDENYDQIFACSGIAPEGSLRVIRSGISVEKLLKTAPIYQGVTGTWTVKLKVTDPYHSFLVLSFVEETRVLSIGVSFSDVTDLVGFQPDVCTLACGLVSDGVMVQIHQRGVRICVPGMSHRLSSLPICTSWLPNEHTTISLGSVGNGIIVVATSSPCFLFILGVKSLSEHHYEVYQMQCMKLQNELSCISIPQNRHMFVVGTHKPSVEVVSFTRDKGVQICAVGNMSLTNTIGTTISGCVPQDVRLVVVDRSYVLAGLRNGMLLRFEWPVDSSVSSLSNSALSAKGEFPVTTLNLIAVRQIGITPVSLVSLNDDSLDADIIALSDRPWLLHTARHSLSYTSISFQPSTNVTPVCSVECPRGILFVAENSLHLVEMVPSKRLNVHKFHIGGTPRKVLYHPETRLLIVLRTELDNDDGSISSDICCVDPLSGSILSSFKFEAGETGKCMELVKVGSDYVLLVGTSTWSGPAIMPTGEAESTKGRLVILYLQNVSEASANAKAILFFQRHCEFDGYASPEQTTSNGTYCDGIKIEDWKLQLAYSTVWSGMCLAVCPYLDRYFLASAGNSFYVCSYPNDACPRVKKLALMKTRFMITTLTAHFNRIAVGDCRDGVIFYSFHEDTRKLEQVYCDPVQRLVADCVLLDADTAVVSDRKGSLAVLSCENHLQENASPERNLSLNCSYYMGEVSLSIRKGSFSYKLPPDDMLRDCDTSHNIINLSRDCIMASTLLGSIIIFIPTTRDEYELLLDVQARLVIHPLTAPILGNDHNEFRSRENMVGAPKMLDGDILSQFLELTSMQQEAVLSLPLSSPITVKSLCLEPSTPLMVNQVVRLLERVHYALN